MKKHIMIDFFCSIFLVVFLLCFYTEIGLAEIRELPIIGPTIDYSAELDTNLTAEENNLNIFAEQQRFFKIRCSVYNRWANRKRIINLLEDDDINNEDDDINNEDDAINIEDDIIEETDPIEEEPVVEEVKYHTVAEMQEIFNNDPQEYFDIIGEFINSVRTEYNILPSVVMAVQLAESGIPMESQTAIYGNNVMGLSDEIKQCFKDEYRFCNGKLYYRYSGDRGWCCYDSIEECLLDAMSFQKYGTYGGYNYFNVCGETNIFKAICKWAYHYNPACKSITGENGEQLDVFVLNGESWRAFNYLGAFDNLEVINNPQKYDLAYVNGYSYTYYSGSWHQLQSSYLAHIYQLMYRYNLFQYN